MKRHILVTSLFAGFLLISGLTLTDCGGEEAAIAVLSTHKRPIQNDSTSGPSSDYEGLYYNDFHLKADKIDLTRLPSAALLDIPEELYAGKVNFALDKVDIEGEIRTYKLICEILLDEGINPSDSDVYIRPYHIYGSWYNEIGYAKKPGEIGFNPTYDKIKNPGEGPYLGPFSLHTSYYNDEVSEPLCARMYTYISSDENPTANENYRSLRATKSELQSTAGSMSWFGINNGQLTLTAEDKEEYIASFRENLKTDPTDRPNPEYASDSIYTYARKLRSNYQGYNNFTLNKQPDILRWEDLDQLYSENVTRNGDFKSDLYFLGSVYKNSSELKPHQCNYSAGYPSAENNYINAMPYMYLEMIEQFGSLDINEIGLFNGWREINTSAQKYFGTKFVTPMYTASITSPDNLVDRLDALDTKVLNKGSIRELMTKVSKYAYDRGGSELEWSLFYPLRCITNGKMIQSGVETMIDQVYQIQLEEGTLLVSEDLEDGESSDTPDEDFGFTGQVFDDDIFNPSELKRRPRLTPEEWPSGEVKPDTPYFTIKSYATVFPLRMASEAKYKVTHGYWCGKNDYDYSYYGCRAYHSPYGQHLALDFTYKPYDPDKEVYGTSTTDIVAFYDGKVVKKTSDGPYGTRIILEHNFDGVVFYTHYAHMKSYSTKHLTVGSLVSAGQRIGHMGSTGNSSGNHLHFALYKDSIEERNTKATVYDVMLLGDSMQKVS